MSDEPMMKSKKDRAFIRRSLMREAVMVGTVLDLLDHADAVDAEIARLHDILDKVKCSRCGMASPSILHTPDHLKGLCMFCVDNLRAEALEEVARLRGQLAAIRHLLAGAPEALFPDFEHGVARETFFGAVKAYQAVLLSGVDGSCAGAPEAAVIATSLEHMKVGKPSTFKAWAQAVEAMHEARKR